MVPSWRACLLIYFPMNIRKGTLSFHPKTTGAVVFWLGWALYDRDIKTLFAWFTRRFAFTRRPYIRRMLCVNLRSSLLAAKSYCEFITLRGHRTFEISCNKRKTLHVKPILNMRTVNKKKTLHVKPILNMRTINSFNNSELFKRTTCNQYFMRKNLF